MGAIYLLGQCRNVESRYLRGDTEPRKEMNTVDCSKRLKSNS